MNKLDCCDKAKGKYVSIKKLHDNSCVNDTSLREPYTDPEILSEMKKNMKAKYEMDFKKALGMMNLKSLLTMTDKKVKPIMMV
jgi:seryl-tRNA(Sec) selenium transferase